MKIVSSIDQYKPDTAYYSWAKRIVQNVVIDDFRKNKRYKDLFAMDTDETEDNIQPEYEEDYSDTETEQVEWILNQLPPATKLTFNLFAIDGYSYKEIAEELNIGYETVKWHVKEARKKLKSLLEENKELLQK